MPQQKTLPVFPTTASLSVLVANAQRLVRHMKREAGNVESNDSQEVTLQ
jgi:hypothetical protein